MTDATKPTPATPRDGAPLDIAALPDWWDAQRALDGKPDASTCAAELRRALEARAFPAERRLSDEERRALGIEQRWNAYKNPRGDVFVCKNEHEKSAGCNYEPWASPSASPRPPAPTGSLRAVAEEVISVDARMRRGEVSDTYAWATVRDCGAKLAAEVIRLEATTRALRLAGAKMANTCFNWAQSKRFDERERKMLKEMQVAWDDALFALALKQEDSPDGR